MARHCDLVGGEAAEALQPPTQAIEHVQHAVAVVDEQNILQFQPTGTTPPRCSTCRKVGHKINICKIASFESFFDVLVVEIRLEHLICGMMGNVSWKYLNYSDSGHPTTILLFR